MVEILPLFYNSTTRKVERKKFVPKTKLCRSCLSPDPASLQEGSQVMALPLCLGSGSSGELLKQLYRI